MSDSKISLFLLTVRAFGVTSVHGNGAHSSLSVSRTLKSPLVCIEPN